MGGKSQSRPPVNVYRHVFPKAHKHVQIFGTRFQCVVLLCYRHKWMNRAGWIVLQQMERRVVGC